MTPISYYLAHPFDSRHAIRRWELALEQLLGLQLLNPFYDSGGRGDVALMDAGAAGPYDCDPEMVVTGDLADLRRCFGLIGIIDGSLSYGTIMEIVYARTLGKPVYLLVTNGHEKHPWLIYHATRIFTTFESLERFLREEFPPA